MLCNLLYSRRTKFIGLGVASSIIVSLGVNRVLAMRGVCRDSLKFIMTLMASSSAILWGTVVYSIPPLLL